MHRRAISRRWKTAASALALLLAGCEDLTLPGTTPGTTLATSDLLILPLSASAPPPTRAVYYLSNAHTTIRALIHNDGFNTLFAQLEVPRGSLESLDGVALGSGDSVLVRFIADSGRFGVSLAPEGLRFASLARPTLTLSYARYGDLSVAAGSRYPDQAAYAAALNIWHEASLERWSSTGGSGNAGTDVSAGLSQAGHYLVAAPR